MSILLASGGLDLFNSYGFIILLSLVIILSYFFGVFAEKTRIPSVLMLIVLGVGLQFLAQAAHYEAPDLSFALEVLGLVGVIMIVLEAALELELEKKKISMIGRSFLAALICLIASSFGISFILYSWVNMGQATEVMSHMTSLIYATPIAIMSSAIIIPSVGPLIDRKKEWMVYESTFSDILGIMMFYFLLSLEGKGEVVATTYGFAGGAILTTIAAFVIGYALIYIFARIEGHVKLFLLVAVLLLLYFTGKLFHLSPLTLILIFGLMLANERLFFRGWMRDYVDLDRVRAIDKDFTTLTAETAFLLRTFFFVVFGFTLNLMTLASGEVWLLSLMFIGVLYGVRWIVLKLTIWKDITPELWIAPRGLITVLLYYAAVKAMPVSEEIFSPGIILAVILISSGIMTWALVNDKGEPELAAAAEGAGAEGAVAAGDTAEGEATSGSEEAAGTDAEQASADNSEADASSQGSSESPADEGPVADAADAGDAADSSAEPESDSTEENSEESKKDDRKPGLDGSEG